MTPATLLTLTVRPTLALLGPRYEGRAAERLLVAIAMEESGLKHRRQVAGPARGLWQFERGGGVAGVLSHPESFRDAKALCARLLYEPTAAAVFAAIADNDVLACGLARLLLWSDPAPLAETDDEAWAYYMRLWRPGKPSRESWKKNWSTADEVTR